MVLFIEAGYYTRFGRQGLLGCRGRLLCLIGRFESRGLSLFDSCLNREITVKSIEFKASMTDVRDSEGMKCPSWRISCDCFPSLAKTFKNDTKCTEFRFKPWEQDTLPKYEPIRRNASFTASGLYIILR